MSEDKSDQNLDTSSSVVRQNLVDTAVSFLLNPEVRNKPEESKAGFLRNKGLTDTEITLAFDRAKADPSYQAISIPHPVAPPLIYHQKKYSFWSQLVRLSSSFAVLAVALYGLHRFYKLYIEPWLFGKKSEKSQLSIMEEQLLKLNTSVVELSTTVSTLEKSINSHKQQIDSMIEASGIASASIAVSSLKTEIGNVKSLLINRHQFPAVPKVASPSIPLWQLQSNENENSETEQESDKDGDPKHDLSMATECDQLTENSVPLCKNASEIEAVSVSSVDELTNHKEVPQPNDSEKV